MRTVTEAQIQPVHLHDCKIAGCRRPRLLRRPVGDRLEGCPVQAVYQRGDTGNWRILLLVEDDDGHWLVEVDRSPWKTTRELARRWLAKCTTAA